MDITLPASISDCYWDRPTFLVLSKFQNLPIQCEEPLGGVSKQLTHFVNIFPTLIILLQVLIILFYVCFKVLLLWTCLFCEVTSTPT